MTPARLISPPTATSAPIARPTSTARTTTARRGRRSSAASAATTSRATIDEDPEAQGTAVPRHRDRRLRLVRRWGHVAAVQPRPAGHAGARRHRQRRRPRHRHAWARRSTSWTTSTCCARSRADDDRRSRRACSSPADAMRSVSRGVAIDYYLKQAADKVTIEILDAQGKSDQVVHRHAPQPPTRRRGRRRRATSASVQPPPRVAVKQGLNRFVWDTRYPDAKDFPGLIMWAGSVRGPAAPPGQYQVRLTGRIRDQDAAVRHRPQSEDQRDGRGSASSSSIWPARSTRE